MSVFQGNRGLLKRFREGDRDALAVVYKHYVDDVYKLVRYGFTLKGNPTTTVAGIDEPAAQLDAVQEIFVRAFSEQARLSYDGLRPFRAFLLRIAKNLRIDQVRKQRREVSLFGENLGRDDWSAVNDACDDSHIVIFEPPTEQHLDWQHLQRATSAFIQSLDPEQRNFVQLRFVEELSQYEIVRRLNITRRRVRTLEKKVMTGLKQYLKTRGLT